MKHRPDMETLILSGEDVRRLVREVGLDELMDCLIARLGHAFLEFDANDTVVPVRDGFSYRNPDIGLIEWMPCFRVGSDVAIKVVGYHPSNPAGRDLPTILSTISLYDASSGHLMCVMDATLLTALRTGAASAVATGLMASKNSSVLGIVGAGAQAVSQVHAISRVRTIDTVLVYDIDQSATASFRDRIHRYFEDVVIESPGLDAIVETADILCTATSVEPGHGPVIPDRHLNPSIHINAVGSDFPEKIELPKGLLERSLVVPDFLEQAVKEGECQQIPPDDIGPELHVLLQNPALHRDLMDRTTVFDSTGWALEDSVAMHVMLEFAVELGLGRRLPLESVSSDPLDPYRALALHEIEKRPA